MKHKSIVINHSVENRFWEKVEKTDTCWKWKGAINPSGHGVLKVNGSNRGAHRVSYAIHNGEIKDGLFICHKCDNAWCVNPDHLYAGTSEQNSQDEIKRRKTSHYTCSNPSKYNGVRWDNERQGWISYVYINKKVIGIGRHKCEVDAARNHDRILFMKYGKKDTLNFPEEYNLSD